MCHVACRQKRAASSRPGTGDHASFWGQAWESDDERRWARYLEWAEAVWQGRVDDVIEQLRAELASRGVMGEASPADLGAQGALVDAARYLDDNRQRMDYPRYRREGLPITSAPRESLIKQVNQRVKGTEMTWNAPQAPKPSCNSAPPASSEGWPYRIVRATLRRLQAEQFSE